MAFDPSKFNTVSAKPLPVFLLLDTSGSMQGEKITKLYDATVDMIENFKEETLKEIVINVAIITFGGGVSLHTALDSVSNLAKNPIQPFTASGSTPLGTAMAMAKDIIEDKEIIPAKSYAPAVVLVSDGKPNDEWRSNLDDFVNSGRTAKAQKFAISIGNDADKDMLLQFVSCDDNLLHAEQVSDISKHFKQITMSVSMRSKSVNPNDIFVNLKTHPNSEDNNIIASVPCGSGDNDDDDEF